MTVTLLSLLMGVVVVLAITAATGYFVAQEFAYMAVDRSRLKARAEAGDAAAARALQVTKRTSFMLSGAQLGITVTGLVVGYVAEPMIGEAIGELLGDAGVPQGLGIAVGTLLTLFFATFVQMLFGELFPKNMAIARSEALAGHLSRSTLIYLKVFGWLIWIFDQSSNRLLKLLGIEPVHDVEHSASARDLVHIVHESADTGDLPPELAVLLDRILDFPTRDVSHAMIPRARVDYVHEGDSLDHVRELMATGHSRYPVMSSDGEQIVGVIDLTDLLESEPDATLAGLQRPALVIPDTMSLPDALKELDNSKNQLACVVDEYGGLAGVLTAEDLAEELVGEITDEHDEQAPEEVVAHRGVWTTAGDVHIDELERTLGCELPRGEYETLAGLVIDAAADLPDVGESIRIELPVDVGALVNEERAPRWLDAVVLEVARHVPALLELRLVYEDEGGEK